MATQRYVSNTLKKKKQKLRKIKTYLYVSVFILLLVGLGYLTQLKQLQIKEVKITGNSFVSTDEIQTIINTHRDSKILWFIPRNNIFLFSKNSVINQLKNNPAIIAASVSKNYFETITVNVEEQEKEAIYCTSLEHTECFYINKDGFIYARVEKFFVPEQEILLYREADQRTVGDVVYTKELHSSVMAFIKSAARYDFRIMRAVLLSDDVIEFHLQQGTRLLTSRYDDFEKDFVNFIALFEQDVLVKEGLTEIDYIDLRFGNKVFYKNKIN